jgi:hypothetical protein
VTYRISNSNKTTDATSGTGTYPSGVNSLLAGFVSFSFLCSVLLTIVCFILYLLAIVCFILYLLAIVCFILYLLAIVCFILYLLAIVCFILYLLTIVCFILYLLAIVCFILYLLAIALCDLPIIASDYDIGFFLNLALFVMLFYVSFHFLDKK